MDLRVSYLSSDLPRQVKAQLPKTISAAVCHPGGVILVEWIDPTISESITRVSGVFIHRVQVHAKNPSEPILMVGMAPAADEGKTWKSI